MIGKRVRRESDLPEISSEAVPEKKKKADEDEVEGDGEEDARFCGEPVPADKANKKWPHRYMCREKYKADDLFDTSKRVNSAETGILQARRHYTQAVVDGIAYDLYDNAYVQGEEGKPHYIAKIVEMFESIDKELHFTAQWYYRAEDTMIKNQAHLIDKRRVFYSGVRDDNPLYSIVSKVKIIHISPQVDLALKEEEISCSDLYCDMGYTEDFYTFTTIHQGNLKEDNNVSPAVSSEASTTGVVENMNMDCEKSSDASQGVNLNLLDLYSGCGAMSTGLCFGVSMSGLNLTTRWAVDINSFACESLKNNHPETEVRNEAAEDFLCLLKEWEKLCIEFQLLGTCQSGVLCSESQSSDGSDTEDGSDGVSPDEFEVAKLLAVCYGDPNKIRKRGLHFKVRWKGYGPSEDTWEPISGLRTCEDSLKEFVSRGYKAKILPLPGDVDFICGGPPCQGISGFNRFRNKAAPLEDPKNHQLVVFMDIVQYLKPKYILMENVVDIAKFADGTLVCYAIGRLVSMNYQARLGIMAAGSYGVPQCRMRVFLWGANWMENLPQFPLPTHEVAGRGVVTNEFKEIIVGRGSDQAYKLEKSALLGDAISDLPVVTNDEEQDEMPYSSAPRSNYQKFIRLGKKDLFKHKVAVKNGQHKKMLYDHLPRKLNDDDFARVCMIPKEKGANFRDLPGVKVDPKNKVAIDQSVTRAKLPSGKPVVPNYALTYVGGSSTKPFGRLAMDEIVTTVVTRAEPHNQVILHPDQDRVLTVRENARLQGFPDCYKLYGPVKERYIQVGNAVAFSVSIALGQTLAKAIEGVSNGQPLPIPVIFPNCLALLSTSTDKMEEAEL